MNENENDTTGPAANRGPGVHFPPPFLFVAGLALAWWLNRRLAFTIDGAGAGFAQTLLGVLAMAAGLALMISGVVTFARARTSIVPNQPARLLVVAGPYRFTRNPMYLGLTVLYFGLALILNSAWSLVLLPVVLGVLSVFVISREERYLATAFGAVYTNYCTRVRRWF